MLNSLFKFAILHKHSKHKFIANIDKTALNINHFAHFNSDKEIKNLLAKIDECADERVKICALFSFAQTTLDANRFCKQPNTSADDKTARPLSQKYAD